MMKTTIESPLNPTMPINLPALALLPNNAKALREHRRRHPSEFEKIIRHKTGLSRYYSDEPSTCVGQWVLSQFTPPESQWVLFYPIVSEAETGDNASLQWYGLHTLSGQIQREHIGTLESTLNEFAFECNQSERVYIPSQTDGDGNSEHDLPLALPGLALLPDKLGVVGAINLHEAHLQHLPKRYLTQSTRRWQRPALIGMVCLCLTGLGAWLALLNTPEPLVKPQTVDPLAQWFTHLSQMPMASTTLSMSETLLSQARLLPQGYTAQTLTLGTGALTLNINQTIEAPNRHTLNIWRQKITTPETTWDSPLNQLHRPAPLAPQDLPISVLGQYPDKLYEQLRLLGADKLTLTAGAQIGQVEDWTLSVAFTGSNLTVLGNVAYLTTNKPVFLQALTVTPHDKGLIDLTLDLTLLGVTP